MIAAQILTAILIGSSLLLIARWLWRRQRRHEVHLLRELSALRRRAHRAIAQSGVAVFAVDTTGTVRWYEGRELQPWRLNGDRCVGRHYREAFAGWPALVDAVREGLRDGRVERREVCDDFAFDIALQTVHDDGGAVSDLVGSIRDAGMEVRETQRAERLARFRTQFLRAINHRLRTPMSSIAGVAELLAESDLADDDRELVDLIRESGDSLLRFVTELIDYGELDAGTLELERSSFDLRQIVDDVTERHRARAGEHGVAVVSRYPRHASRRFVGDGKRVEQIIEHLVGNAAEFTTSGHVLVDVRESGRHLDETTVEISVADSGPGFERGQAERAFDGLAAAGPDDVGRSDRVGLGLAISRRLAVRLGGTLELETEPGAGSTFTLRLDLEREAPGIDAIREAKQVTEARALLVEDSEMQRGITERMLRSLGCHVVTASNGFEALSAYDRESFDVVLMDCEMPGMDGYEASAAIRALPAPRARVPIVALTAAASSAEDVARREAAGMHTYLAKPASREALERALREALAIAATGAADDILDETVVEELRDLDRGHSLGELIRAFLDVTPGQLLAIGDAVASGDPVAVSEASSLLRTSCRLLGARDLARACEALQIAVDAEDREAARVAVEALEGAYARLSSLLAQMETVHDDPELFAIKAS